MNITQIKIKWSESNQVKDETVFNSLEDANQVLRRIARDERGKIGYCKVAYCAKFEDSEEYDGRIDVTEHENHCFLEAMQSFVKFYLGKANPHWMTAEQYKDVIGNAPNNPEYIAWGKRLGV